MATGDRKQTGSKQGRSSRRRRAATPRGNEKDESSPQEQTPSSESQPPPSKQAPKEAPQMANGEKVSSLLETTSQEVKQLLEAADDAAQKIREAAQTDAETEQDSTSGGEASTLIKRTNKEVRQVLESADETAEKIREEARAEARQFVDEARRRAEDVTNQHLARVSKLSELVLGELTSVQGQLESLRSAFDQAINAMAIDIGVGAEGGEVWDTAQNGAPEVEEESDLRRRLGRRRQRKSLQEPEGISEGARLLALQQLMAGVDAEVIAIRLEKEFGIENPRAILEWMGLQVQPEDSSKKR
jgi:F0F1-type ATP synthase membrane subunit b/b'